MNFLPVYTRFVFFISFLFCSNISLAIQDGVLEDYEQEAVRHVVTSLLSGARATPTAAEIIHGTQGLLPDSDDAIIAVTVFVADQGLLAPQHSAVSTADDAMVAQLLQLQLNEAVEKERADQRAADALQEEERRQAYEAHQQSLAARAAKCGVGKAKLSAIFDKCRAYDAGDVHGFNAGIVKLNYPELRALDLEHFGAEATAPARPTAEIIAEIKAFSGAKKLPPRFPRAQEYFATIMAHPAGKIESETGIDPITLFSRLWVLAKGLDADPLKHHNFQLPNQDVLDARTFLYYSIHENLAEQGGCWPGFSGRLFQVYLQILSSKMS